MIDLQGVKEKEKRHYEQCPECGEWFDMRDLSVVMLHQHWIEEKINNVSFSHVQQVGETGKFYIRAEGKMLTLCLSNRGKDFPTVC